MNFIFNSGIVRETSAILILYMGTILGGYGHGFSAISIPDIKNEMRKLGIKLNGFESRQMIFIIKYLSLDFFWEKTFNK